MKRTETYRVAAAALRAVCQSLANVLFAAANPVFAASVVVFIPFIGRARVQPLGSKTVKLVLSSVRSAIPRPIWSHAGHLQAVREDEPGLFHAAKALVVLDDDARLRGVLEVGREALAALARAGVGQQLEAQQRGSVQDNAGGAAVESPPPRDQHFPCVERIISALVRDAGQELEQITRDDEGVVINP